MRLPVCRKKARNAVLVGQYFRLCEESRPQGTGERTLSLRLADLKKQRGTFPEMRRSLQQGAFNQGKAAVPGKEGFGRFVIADILRQGIAFVMGNIGKIRDNRVKFLIPEGFKQRAAEKPHVRKRKRSKVPFGPAERVHGNFRPPDLKVGTLRGQRKGDRAGSRAEFAYARAGRQISDEQFRKQFRLRTGNQRAGPDLQIQKAELRPAENILKRFFFQPACKVSAPFPALLRSQGPIPEKRQFDIRNAGNFRDNIGALQLRRFKAVPAECFLQFLRFRPCGCSGIRRLRRDQSP